jgi:hypothetical protein
MSPSLFCSLDHDWHHQATRLRSRQALQRWAEAQPARRGDHEETAAAVVAACWERIRTYPIDRRPRRIAANILLDTRQRVIRQYNQPTSDAGETKLEELTSEATAHAGVELLNHAGEAMRRCRLDPDEARLILLTRVADVPLSQLAVGSGRGLETMRRRRRAAEARLASAVA